jgi:glycosyltransferase involved in cell wall biosynthesis
MSGPVVLGVERVYNPHVLPIFDALRARADIRFTGCVLERLKPWRVDLGWSELPADSPYLQPWRRRDDRKRYFELVRSADVVIWTSLKFERSVRLILGRLLRGRLVALWMERFRERRERHWYETLGMKATVRLVNSPNVHLMALGEGAADDFRAYGATRWKVWQFGYAVEPVPRPALRGDSRSDGPLRLLFAGFLRSKKGVEVLLRALGTPSLAGRSWWLEIAGDGQERPKLEALAQRLGIADQVEFTGVVGHEEIGEVYRHSDVLVLPSHYEGWGAVINEAMEHELAVVASDGAGAARILVDHGRTGFVFPRGDAEALADCLGRLVATPELSRAMGRAGRVRIEQFRPKVAAERAARLFRGLTGHAAMPEYTEGYCQPIL